MRTMRGGGSSENRALELAHFSLNPHITLTSFTHPLRHPIKNHCVFFPYLYFWLTHSGRNRLLHITNRICGAVFKKMPLDIQWWYRRWFFVEQWTNAKLCHAHHTMLKSHNFAFANNAYVCGCFQNLEYFSALKDTLQKDFRLKTPLSAANARLKEKILQTPDSVFLHIRRGDYLNLWHFIELGSAYYNNALREIKARVQRPNVFVFSNDILWCEQHFLQSLDSKVREGVRFEFVRGNSETNAAEEMELMRSCKHAIIANSTFSWWAAYLIGYKDKVVCMPRYIFCNPHYAPNDLANYLQCPGWILINHIW